ncbi:hypothetical protein BRADI_1g44536v3 [Brachypodium distachyon]|uniref:Uncharacterized protein n=1 Tax=Brachypodium distachyon TaxID=15368 RepID=A0A0Q3H732_BRADI|nr:hypothetical protein BRADI_1g44536v3 [Brachypodium distachyon]
MLNWLSSYKCKLMPFLFICSRSNLGYVSILQFRRVEFLMLHEFTEQCCNKICCMCGIFYTATMEWMRFNF